MKIEQLNISIGPFKRGAHLITSEIEKVLKQSGLNKGLCNIFCLHTSASLTINENADPTVRSDFETALNMIAPESENWLHADEGPDDMPAHVKTSITNTSLSLPVSDGRFVLGTWQGIYFCEHRNHGGNRKLFLTFMGE